MAKKILIFIVAYNAERTIESVLSRIPEEVYQDERYSLDILIIDDCSQDRTFERGYGYQKQLPLTVLYNPVNLGYGGNQKLGYRYAIEQGYDIVALLHGDGQYAPEQLPKLFEPLLNEECEAVFGSRMMPEGDPLGGGMPLYKYVGNKILSRIENRLIGTELSEWHSGYRLYATSALKRVPFEYNSDDFDFDTDIIIQLHSAEAKIKELSIPTFYGDEICHVNGIGYAIKIVLSCLKARIQRWGLFYDPKFDLFEKNEQYVSKFGFLSSHSLALQGVNGGERVLLLGCGGAELNRPYFNKGCFLTAVDLFIDESHEEICEETHQADLDSFEFSALEDEERFDAVLALDIIEHLKDPEGFLKKLRNCSQCRGSKMLITTPNIAFLPMRLMLLIGSFNYGKRGILDRTHTRLFTFKSLRRLFEQTGYEVITMKGIPAPVPLAIGEGTISSFLFWCNRVAIFLWKSLFFLPNIR